LTTVESIGQPESQLPALEEVGPGPSGSLLEVAVGVILAAGSSSRLGGVPKPLARVAGVTLLERALSTFRNSGVERIVVVVGHASANVREFVARRGLDVGRDGDPKR
jgi:CTP:molybdopterin cytidylyltransferase MocA